jgi:ABC-2 type transport system ATP-binding protein
VAVAAEPRSWWEVLPGVRAVDRSDGAVVLELDEGSDPQRVLDLARAEGDVQRFGPVRPGLAELFREVVQE